jgi:hypothetical protein
VHEGGGGASVAWSWSNTSARRRASSNRVACSAADLHAILHFICIALPVPPGRYDPQSDLLTEAIALTQRQNDEDGARPAPQYCLPPLARPQRPELLQTKMGLVFAFATDGKVLCFPLSSIASDVLSTLLHRTSSHYAPRLHGNRSLRRQENKRAGCGLRGEENINKHGPSYQEETRYLERIPQAHQRRRRQAKDEATLFYLHVIRSILLPLRLSNLKTRI